MYKPILYFLILLMHIFVSCKEKTIVDSDKYYARLPTLIEKNFLVDAIALDSILIKDLPSSYNGYVRVFGDTIFLIDYLSNRVFPISINGNALPFRLGDGRGPSEFFGGIIHNLVFLEDGDFIILGTSWDLHYFNSDWRFQEMKRVNWQSTKPTEVDDQNPNPANPYNYTFTYHTERDKARVLGDHLYCEVLCEHPKMNMFNSRDYYQKVRVVGKVEIATGIVDTLMGFRSLEYEKYNFIGQFSRALFDVSQSRNQFYLGFEPDDLIYVCDDNFVPIRAFGVGGVDMKKAYTEYNGFDEDEIKKIIRNDWKTRGYYTRIEYIEERDLLFRAYNRGDHSPFDGLQVYKNEILVADVDVPKGFRVEGYIAPYFVSSFIPDPMYESGKIYLFKLDL